MDWDILYKLGGSANKLVKNLSSLVRYDDSSLEACIIPVVRPGPNIRSHSVLFQIIEPAVAVSLNALDFTVCYDLTKVHFNSADCLNT